MNPGLFRYFLLDFIADNQSKIAKQRILMTYTMYSSRRSAARNKTRSTQNFGVGSGGNRRGRSRGPKKAYINPARFVKAAQPLEESQYEATHRFTDFMAHPLLLSNL